MRICSSLVVIIGGLAQDVIDNISLETGTGNYQNIIIAHKTGADTVFDALVRSQTYVFRA